MSVASAKAAAAETMPAAVHPVPHRLTHHVVHSVALAAPVSVHSVSIHSMSHPKTPSCDSMRLRYILKQTLQEPDLTLRGTFANFRRNP
jgi:hypothetical protein